MIAVSSASEELYKEFIKFVDDLSKKDALGNFWHGFVFHDCLAYVGLYVAIRVRLRQLQTFCLPKTH